MYSNRNPSKSNLVGSSARSPVQALCSSSTSLVVHKATVLIEPPEVVDVVETISTPSSNEAVLQAHNALCQDDYMAPPSSFVLNSTDLDSNVTSAIITNTPTQQEEKTLPNPAPTIDSLSHVTVSPTPGRNLINIPINVIQNKDSPTVEAGKTPYPNFDDSDDEYHTVISNTANEKLAETKIDSYAQGTTAMPIDIRSSRQGNNNGLTSSYASTCSGAANRTLSTSPDSYISTCGGPISSYTCTNAKVVPSTSPEVSAYAGPSNHRRVYASGTSGGSYANAY